MKLHCVVNLKKTKQEQNTYTSELELNSTQFRIVALINVQNF